MIGRGPDMLDVSTTFTADDWVDYVRRNARGVWRTQQQRILTRYVPFLFAALFSAGAINPLLAGRIPSIKNLWFVDAPVEIQASMSAMAVLSVAFVVVLYVGYKQVARWRLRRWFLREHGTTAIATRYCSDAFGLTVSDDFAIARKEWPAVIGLEETDRLFFMMDKLGHAAPIPRRDFSDTDADRLRGLVAAHVGEHAVASDIPPRLPDDMADARVLVSFMQTSEHRAAASILQINTRKRRRERAVFVAITLVGTCLLFCDLDMWGWWSGWLQARHPAPFAIALRKFLHGELRGLLPLALMVIAYGGAMWLIIPINMRRRYLRLARILGDIPMHVAVDAKGVAVAMPGTSILYRWSAVRDIQQNNTHLGLLFYLGTAVAIPKAALDGAGLEMLRHLVSEHTRIGGGVAANA